MKALALAVVSLLPVQAFAMLVEGDIAIITYNADGSDLVAWTPLVDLAEGQQITFTDNGWFSSGSFRSGEGTITYTAPVGGLAAGTIESFDNLALSTSGDQVFAFTGTLASPTLIYGIGMNSATGFDSNATSSNTSALPADLTLGFSAIGIPEVDNATYNMSVTTGTKGELLTAISNPDNWTTNNSSPFAAPSGSFTVVAVPEPTAVLVSSLIAGALGLTVARRPLR